MDTKLTVPNVLMASLALLLIVIVGGFLFMGQLETVATPAETASSVSTVTDIDQALAETLADHGVYPFAPKLEANDELFVLGQALFFDPELSGNRDVSCATCHHPNFATGDALPLSVGTGGMGLGDGREIGYDREFAPRNAPELFNRNSDHWTTVFWDGRINGSAMTGFVNPAGDALPEEIKHVIAAQAMFPITSRDEMRGLLGDTDVHGLNNELASISEGEFELMWEALFNRVIAHPGYVEMLEAAYPKLTIDEMNFAHAANAIAAFEMLAYTFVDSPFDRYLDGDFSAMTEQEKRGALLFYGEAGCASCHSGTLLTDQEFHNIAVAQYGPGKGDESPADHGRFRETAQLGDIFAFRTPPLRNVALTGPYMHNGAYDTLEAAVQHHLDVVVGLSEYDLSSLPVAYQHIYDELSDEDKALLADNEGVMLDLVAPELEATTELSEAELADLMAFLHALTSPSALDLSHTIPDSVPSGLPIEQ